MINTNSAHHNSSVESPTQNVPHWQNVTTSHQGREINNWEEKVSLGHQEPSKKNRRLDGGKKSKNWIISTRKIKDILPGLLPADPISFQQMWEDICCVSVDVSHSRVYSFSLITAFYHWNACYEVGFENCLKMPALNKCEMINWVEFSFMIYSPSALTISEGDIRVAKVTC